MSGVVLVSKLQNGEKQLEMVMNIVREFNSVIDGECLALSASCPYGVIKWSYCSGSH